MTFGGCTFRCSRRYVSDRCSARVGIALFSSSNLFYTDASLMDGVAGFAVHHSIDCNIGFRIRGPASVFTAELAAIRMAMDHIENEALGRC
jgi:hypothetical protein